MTQQKYGWKPDLLDIRDYQFQAPRRVLDNIPSSVDLRSYCPPVYNQGHLGSCTGNAIAGAIEFDRLKQMLPDFVPSVLFIYYNERAAEGTVASDAGASIRDGIKSVNSLGACSEADWPYDISQFAVEPTTKCYTDAILDRALLYQSVPQSLNQMKACLASGYPFVYGFTVYSSFESQQATDTGVIPMPQWGDTVLGGHAVLAVGYNDATQEFYFRNSWGDAWGEKGYGYMPYQYLQSRLASDFWQIQQIGSN